MEKENHDIKTRKQDLAAKYGIDFDKLEKEQLKLAKELSIKNKIDFSLSDRFGAFDNIFINNKLLSCIIVCDKNFEIIDRAYAFEKVRFPYVPGFRSYRELPAMIIAFNNLHEKPDVVFVPGQGIIHPRLGLASHFSLSTGVPSIGVSDSFIDCEIKDEDILKDGKKVGKLLKSKPESNPMYISPGSLISVESSYELSKQLIHLPHKKPEPMHLAGKYAREVRKELASENP
ncbi:MAG: endonuclease V [Candidatus Nanoarchaeia archaeon]|nr:endonuclease V [Candidatus Nanoarchaeia archaeon]